VKMIAGDMGGLMSGVRCHAIECVGHAMLFCDTDGIRMPALADVRVGDAM
jgi:hypothetical protein